MRKSLIAISAVSALLVAGCTPTEPPPSEEEVLTSFLNQILGDSQTSSEAGFEYLGLDSPARSLVNEITSRLSSAEQDGVLSVDDLVPSLNYSEPATEEEEALLEDASLCFDSSSYPEASRENFCFIFNDFEFLDGQLIGVSLSGEPVEWQIVLKYFSAHALAQPEDRIKARDFAFPGSNAEAYAIQQSQSTQAQLDGGAFDATINDLVFREGGFFNCSPRWKNPDVLFEDACSGYSEFAFEGNRLADFNAGPTPLEGRIFMGSGEVLEIGSIGTIKVLSAYETIGGYLWLTTEVVSNTEELNIETWRSVYVVGGDRQVDNSGSEGPSNIKDGRRAYVSFLFSGARIGGELEVNFYDQNFRDVFMTIPVG